MLKIYPFKKNPTTQVILNKNIDKLINEIEVTKRPDSVNIFKQKVNVSTIDDSKYVVHTHALNWPVILHLLDI